MHFSPTKIKHMRLDQGWSQEQLGEVAGLSSRTIQRIESQGSASAESLKAIASAFSVSINDLSLAHEKTIGDGKFKPSGLLGLLLILASLTFYLTISGEPSAIIDLPALMFVLIVPFSISCVANGCKATVLAYQLILWLIYEAKTNGDLVASLAVLQKLIEYSYVCAATGCLFSILGMVNSSIEVYYPAGISVILLIVIYAGIQSELVFRPLYHKLNRLLVLPAKAEGSSH